MPTVVEHNPSCVSRHKHHLHAGPLKFESCAQLDARHPRHFNVGKKKIDRSTMISRLPEGIRSACSHEHGEAGPGQKPRDERKNLRLIVDNENSTFNVRAGRTWFHLAISTFPLRCSK